MTSILALLLGAAVAAVVASRVAAHVAVSGPLRARNYRGLELPTGAGVAVVLGIVAGSAAVAVVDVAGGAGPLSGWAARVAAAAVGFGLLGLWDDVAASAHERGWRAHLRALREGRPTTGAIKLVAGGALAFLLAARPDLTFPHTLLHAALIALSANLVNLLDLRPGRAAKFSIAFLVPCVIATLVAGVEAWVPLVVVIAAAGAFLPFDLRERAMLGDVGANALGAALGIAIETAAHRGVEIGVVVALVGLHLAGDRPGLSRLIARTPPLAAFDRAGRVPE